MMKVFCPEVETYEFGSYEIKVEAKFDSPQDMVYQKFFSTRYRLIDRAIITYPKVVLLLSH